MSTTLEIRFPLGRYHANPWNRAVNEGATEWPPSPWRVLRALIATWYTRWPDLPSGAMDGLLEALADPPSYWTPRARAGHTRHYLPDLEHRKGEQGNTDLTLDPFLSVSRDEKLLVQWDADLTAEQREVLGKLAELIPYLGRADSACEARLLDEDPVPDGTWWRSGVDGARTARLLAPAKPVSRVALEATTTEVRKRRRTMPPGTVWVRYGAGDPAFSDGRSPERVRSDLTAVRFAVLGKPVAMRAVNGVLLADDVHYRAGQVMTKAGIRDERRQEIMGTGGARSEHRHAHWIPVPASAERGAPVTSMLVWVPDGLQPEELRALLANDLRTVSGKRGGADGYQIRGFPELELLFQAAGPVEQVIPQLCKPSRRWRSLTPYLPVRHRKRESVDEFITADVRAELNYRPGGTGEVTVTRIEPGTRILDHWASEFRRRRTKERLTDSRASRPGLGLRLEFAEPVGGPLVLGQLSHFGFGLFEPEDC